MHRVELKVLFPQGVSGSSVVPNAPCGVESIFVLFRACILGGFLMHRVELKV